MTDGESMPWRTPNFSPRSAEEDAPSDSAHVPPQESGRMPYLRTYEPLNPSSSRPANRQRHSMPSNFFSALFRWNKRDSDDGGVQDGTEERVQHHVPLSAGPLRESSTDRSLKDRGRPKVDGSGKLETFSGVFVPTTLNVLSILMFLRFGFILGQAGLLGMLGKWMLNFPFSISLLRCSC